MMKHIKLIILITLSFFSGCKTNEEEQYFYIDICYKLNGFSAMEVERKISLPIEGLLSDINEIKHVYSASSRDRALITAAIHTDVKPAVALNIIKERLNSNSPNHPKTTVKPEMIVITDRTLETQFCF